MSNKVGRNSSLVDFVALVVVVVVIRWKCHSCNIQHQVDNGRGGGGVSNGVVYFLYDLYSILVFVLSLSLCMCCLGAPLSINDRAGGCVFCFGFVLVGWLLKLLLLNRYYTSIIVVFSLCSCEQ